MENKIFVIIQVCQGCSSHQWNTRHNEAKYNQFYELMANEFRKMIGDDCTVLKNTIPKEYLQFDCFQGLNSQDKSMDLIRMAPRVGAFEVYYKSFCIFSKMGTGIWPRTGLVAKKLQDMIERIRNREDITSLISRSPTLQSEKKNRGSNNSSMRKGNAPPAPNFGQKTRSKFLKTFGQGFSSPTSASSMSNKNRTTTNKFGSVGMVKYSPVRTSRSGGGLSASGGLRPDMLQKQQSNNNQEQKKEGGNEQYLDQTNPFELEETRKQQANDQIKGKRDQENEGGDANRNQNNAELSPSNHIAGDESTQAASRPVTPVNINVIQSEQQELYLFAALQNAQIPSNNNQREEEKKNRQPSQLPKVIVSKDVFEEDQQNEKAAKQNQNPGLLQNPQNQKQEYQGSYLSDMGSEVSENPDAPNLEVQQSENQPLLYFGDGVEMSGVVAQPVIQQQTQAKKEEVKMDQLDKPDQPDHAGSEDESNYSNSRPPSPVELTVDQSPDQGILFVNQENIDLRSMEHQKQSLANQNERKQEIVKQQQPGEEIKKEDDQDDEYADDQFEKSADISRNKSMEQEQEQKNRYEDINKYEDQLRDHEI